ncbi:hypothetical protein WA026_016014 [Henosepilachna vigintioctopunctata]|uniref:Uncharacterized protein n=1 Tax=Henosepilachna vigintioctopunctata TaxID=420089 RepID=A0AAW1U8M9_9CUCU
MEKFNTCCAALSFLILISGILLSSSSSNLYHSILDKTLDFAPGKILYDKWLTASPPLHLDIYFFNWTNPEEFGIKSKKPTFVEVGPFRFDVRVEKTNMVQIQQRESVHDLNYTVTVLNQLSAAAVYRAKDLNFFLRKSVSVSLSSMSSVQMTKTVGELLFEGAHFKILKFFRTMAFTETIPDKFGFFYEKNGSSDGIFNIGAGHKNNKMGMLYNWNGDNSTKFFDEECRNIGGASMDFFTDNINGKMVEIFNPEICRKVPSSTLVKVEFVELKVTDTI